MTESFDEDYPKAPSKSAAKSLLQKRSPQLVAVAVVAAVGILYTQLMPGGLLAHTSLGHAVQGVARAVARAIATVKFTSEAAHSGSTMHMIEAHSTRRVEIIQQGLYTPEKLKPPMQTQIAL